MSNFSDLFEDMWLHDNRETTEDGKEIDNYWTCKKRTCTGCDAEQDGLSGMGRDNSGNLITPQPGSVCICADCGQLNMFDDKLQFVEPPQEVYDSLPLEAKEIIAGIKSMAGSNVSPTEMLKRSQEEGKVAMRRQGQKRTEMPQMSRGDMAAARHKVAAEFQKSSEGR